MGCLYPHILGECAEWYMSFIPQLRQNFVDIYSLTPQTYGSWGSGVYIYPMHTALVQVLHNNTVYNRATYKDL